MKRIFKTFISLTLLIFFLGGAGLLSSCTPEDQPGEETPGDDPVEVPDENEEPDSDADGVQSFAKFIGLISKGSDLEIPRTGEWILPYKGFKAGDKITLTTLTGNKTYELTCTSADDQTGAKFSVPAGYLGGMCNVVAVANNRTTEGTCFVLIVDTEEVEKKAGYTSYGRVVDLDGNPVSGVSVSDGVLVTVTDAQGQYYLRSERKNGYVFVSVPKGYRVPVKKSVPQFFRRYQHSKSTYELHSFVLEKENNTRNRIVIFTDTHLANRTDDIKQFNKLFIPEFQEQIEKAKAEGVVLYGLALGDLAWDQFWYDNDFDLGDYVDLLAGLDMPIYSAPGNHDNDPNVVMDDFLAAAGFRDNIGPTTYSVNIGDVHYIMMDNTIFQNFDSNGVNDYDHGFTDDQLKWLEADLKTVPAGTTIVFGNHIQVTGRPNATNAFTYTLPATYRTKIFEWLAPFKVHFISGHTHINYTNMISSSMMEHNIAGVCGTWWWTGYYTSGKCSINGDGSPAGYKIFNIDGSDVKWAYKVAGRDASYQFRAYDLRNSQITRADYCPTSKTNVSDSFFSQYANGWDLTNNTTSTKKVLVNVFGYNKDWKVEILENGTSLKVNQVEGYDPLHTVHFNMARMSSGTKGSTSMTFPTGKTAHLFEASTSSITSSVVIRVTDSFGTVYEETMTRPRKLLDMSKENKW